MAHNHHEHHHGHKHLHAHGGLKGQVILIIVTILLFIGAVLIEKNCNLPTWQLLLVYLVPYLLVGYHTLAEAAEGILGGDIFNEHFLMSIATIGALCIGFFPEAVFVMLFFQIGELFENYAEGKSRGSISHLMDIRPDVANVEIGGKLVTVSPENVNVGDIIVIKPGEKVPLDGKIIDGTSSLNTIALTGESMPRDLSVGDDVISGCVNLTGVIRVKTTKDFGESTVSKIIELVESADEHKSKSESFITKFAHVYPDCGYCRIIACCYTTVIFIGGICRVVPGVVSPCTDFSRSIMSMCFGDQCTAHILWGTWRCITQRYSY